MRFVDEVEIRCIAGKGGAGCSSFHKEKFVAYGGPDGGDGGDGGPVTLYATHRCNTLDHLRGRRVYSASPGVPGTSRHMHGRKGEGLEIKVPVGTVVVDIESGMQLADLSEDDQRVVLCQGGKGGRGNARFKTALNRAPTRRDEGRPGEDKHVRLELKLIADVGLLGFPNAGKSTLISVVSNARPRVADYPFTTLVPNLGTVSRGWEGAFVIADIPGLVQGASEGVGLGLRFLKHVERCRFFLHLVAASAYGEPIEDPMDRFDAINGELVAFSPELGERQQIVVLTKTDLVTDDELAELIARFEARGHQVHTICAPLQQGTKALMDACWHQLQGLDT